MIDCKYELNGQSLSFFQCGTTYFPAFSGLGKYVNTREAARLADWGPIPPGTYYIFDRQSGGLLGPFRDLFNDHDKWFALYAIDGKIDDETFCKNVKRGGFRLHPAGDGGISLGCITLPGSSDFQILRTMLKRQTPSSVPGSKLLAYGKVVVT